MDFEGFLTRKTVVKCSFSPRSLLFVMKSFPQTLQASTDGWRQLTKQDPTESVNGDSHTLLLHRSNCRRRAPLSGRESGISCKLVFSPPSAEAPTTFKNRSVCAISFVGAFEKCSGWHIYRPECHNSDHPRSSLFM